MGIFDFVKGAGEKIFKPGETRREAAIEKHLAGYGITGIAVEVDGDKATLSGTAKDTATREKAVLIAGNVDGIGSVDDRVRVTRPALNAATAAAPAAPRAASAPARSTPATMGTTSAAGATGGATETAQEWSSRTYTVKSGDTLSKIAKEMYGEASKYPQIFEANKPMLTDPDKIYPGQVLRVPPEE